MTNQQHPITPPEDLLQQLRRGADTWLKQITIAYQAGADQELEACANYIDNNMSCNKAREFRAIRRPKPPSLKEEALAALSEADQGLNESEWQQRSDTIRRALEALPND